MKHSSTGMTSENYSPPSDWQNGCDGHPDPGKVSGARWEHTLDADGVDQTLRRGLVAQVRKGECGTGVAAESIAQQRKECRVLMHREMCAIAVAPSAGDEVECEELNRSDEVVHEQFLLLKLGQWPSRIERGLTGARHVSRSIALLESHSASTPNTSPVEYATNSGAYIDWS